MLQALLYLAGASRLTLTVAAPIPSASSSSLPSHLDRSSSASPSTLDTRAAPVENFPAAQLGVSMQERFLPASAEPYDEETTKPVLLTVSLEEWEEGKHVWDWETLAKGEKVTLKVVEEKGREVWDFPEKVVVMRGTSQEHGPKV
ncbi:hypothetical protein JCM8547_005599 [Rhodosporidiobolus lusitaniae]